MTVGERIAQKRKENNLSMEALGELLGVGRSAINKWEKGHVERIKREDILKMARIFDCDPAWLGGYTAEDEDNSNNEMPDDTAYARLTREIYKIFTPEELEDPEFQAMIVKLLELAKKVGTTGLLALLEFANKTVS